MREKTTTQSGGIGFCGLLAIVFIVLKLTGYIAWSWWWVLSPLWLGLAIVLGILLLVGIGALILAFFESRAAAKRIRNFNRNRP